VPTNPQIQCSVLLACTRAATIESKQQVSQYRQALPSDTSYHNSAQCRMLCRVLSSTTQSHSLYSQSPKQAATQHLAPPKAVPVATHSTLLVGLCLLVLAGHPPGNPAVTRYCGHGFRTAPASQVKTVLPS
jgi:hypothetical protein